MTILFSANIPKEDQEKLKIDYPNQTFTFCKDIQNARVNWEEVAVLVTFGDDVTADMIEKAVNLKWIMVLSAGLEQMPLEAIAKKDILVTNVRGIHKIPMAEYVISMLLQVYRQEKRIIESEAKKKWDKSVKMQEISNKRLLVIGTGSIGQEVARLGQAFHMETIGLSRSGKQVESFSACYQMTALNDKVAEADFIVSVLPSTAETKGVFSAKQFSLMQEHAVFVNIGRGDAIVEDDLLAAIRNEELAHAVLDVFDVEPLAEDHPFWEEENITVTPHISATTSSYIPRALEMFEHNLQIYEQDGKDYLNEIDVKRGY